MNNLQEHGYTVAMYFQNGVYAGRMSAEGKPVLSENAVRLDRFEADQVVDNLQAAGWIAMPCGYWQ